MDIKKYFRDLECSYWHEYPYAYGSLNVFNKSVQIVGADCGSSALYFLWRGATHIVQYEKEQKLREKWQKVCQDFSICDKAEMRSEWSGQYDATDIFVMDCEGCEESLNVDRLKQYQQWCVAIHDWTKNRVDLVRRLRGAKITYITDDGKEIVLCKTNND